MAVHRDKFIVIKSTRCTNFPNLFWKETLHVSESSSVHHQEFFTAHTAMVQDETKKRELLKTPTKIEEIQENKFIDRN